VPFVPWWTFLSLNTKNILHYHVVRRAQCKFVSSVLVGHVWSYQGCTNPEQQTSQPTKLCTVVTDICRSVWILVHVTQMASKILRWHLDFWDICVPLVIIIVGFMGYTSVFCL
jgi:hypothetical protein